MASVWLSVVLLFTAVHGFCPDFWTRFEGSCYLFKEQQEKWHSAQNSCRSMESHLVEIDTHQENMFLMNEIGLLNMDQTDAFWTGGNDIEIEGVWKWADSFTSIKTAYWYPGEPNSVGPGSHQEDCIDLPVWQNLNWNDENCDRPFSYICEIEDRTDGGSVEVVG